MKKERKPFEVGERVRVFSHYGPWDGVVKAVNTRGNSPRGYVDGLLVVENEEGRGWYQHPRQCVRLKRKQKKEEARVEIITDTDFSAIRLGEARTGNKILCWKLGSYEFPGAARTIHLVELKPGEVIVSKESLAKAWDASYLVEPSAKSSAFLTICEALGLESKA